MNQKRVQSGEASGRGNPQLRRHAEAQLASASLPARPVDNILHELRVHQIELEMQNEELRLAQIALEESRDRYVDLYEFAPVGYVTLTRAGQIAEANLTAATLLGVERKRLLNRRFSLFIADDDRERWQLRYAGLFGQQGGEDLDLRLKRGDSTMFYADLKYRICSGDETRPILRVAFTDITERRRNEAALQVLRAEMEEAMRLHVARQTVAAMAHELNQPLNALANYSEAALRMLSTGNREPGKLRHALEANTQQAQRAGKVVHELLEFLNMGEVKTEAVDLNSTVCIALARLEKNGRSAFQCHVALDPDLAPVSTTHLQVEKVLINLIKNGIEAMHGAGMDSKDISVTTGTSADGNMAQVTVSDRGPGIERQTLDRIFDPFFSTKPQGLGMGLTISCAIIEAQGGRLWGESAGGCGASFHFTLPFAPPVAESYSSLTR